MSERNFGKFDPRGIPGKINSWVHQPVDVKKRDLLIAAGVGVPAGLTLAYLGFSNSEVYAGPPTTPTGELPIVKGFEAPIRVVDELDGKELLIYNSQTRLREDPEIADNVLIELVDAGTIAEVVPPKDTKLISTDPKKPHTTVEGDGYVWSSVKLISGADTGEQGFSANSAGGKLLLSPIPLESVPDDVRSQFQHIEEISIPAALKAVNITEIFDTTNIGGGGESLEAEIMNLWGDETRQETRTVTNGGYKYINGVKTWIPAVTETIDVIATTHDVNTSPLKAWQRAVGIGYIEATNQIDETKIGDDGSFEMKNIAGLKPEGNIVINVSIIGDTTRILSRAGDVFIVTDIEIDEKNKESVKIGAVDWNALSTLFDPDRVSEIVSNMTDLGGEDPDGLLAEIGGLNEMSKVFFPVEGGVFLPKVDVTLANDLLGLSGNDAMTAQSFGDVDYAYDPESGEMTATFGQNTFVASENGGEWEWIKPAVPIEELILGSLPEIPKATVPFSITAKNGVRIGGNTSELRFDRQIGTNGDMYKFGVEHIPELTTWSFVVGRAAGTYVDDQNITHLIINTSNEEADVPNGIYATGSFEVVASGGSFDFALGPTISISLRRDLFIDGGTDPIIVNTNTFIGNSEKDGVIGNGQILRMRVQASKDDLISKGGTSSGTRTILEMIGYDVER